MCIIYKNCLAVRSKDTGGNSSGLGVWCERSLPKPQWLWGTWVGAWVCICAYVHVCVHV